MGTTGVAGAAVRLAAAAVDLVLPRRCAGCRGPGGPVCAGCRHSVRASARAGGWRSVEVTGGSSSTALGVHAAARFEGALRSLVTAWKDEGRHDTTGLLAGLLAGVLATVVVADPVLRATLEQGGRVVVVPVPASRAARRRRGGDPVADLARRAVGQVRGPPGGPSLELLRVLRHVRRVGDQSRLTRDERRANLHGALAVRSRSARVVEGACVVLVDDVVTTGATLAEAARVLGAEGAAHIVGAVVGATPRRDEVGATGFPLAL